MKLFYTLVGLVFLIVTNCGDKKNDLQAENKSQNEQTSEITPKTIEKFRFNDYVLSADAEESISTWLEFVELSKQMDFLKKADLTFFSQDEKTLKTFLTEFKESIPESVNTNPIKARILVLETRLLKLHNDLTLDNISKEEQLKSIKNLLEAKSNLNFVINKKLEFEANDVGRPEIDEAAEDELSEIEILQDSIEN